MAETKEYREFFLRATVVTSGTKPDQEGAFPTTYYIGTTLVYNRFLKNHFPSEKVFKKLFESIAFKKNQEDTAKLAEQGLTKIATDADAESRTSALITDFTATTVPHQLPEIVLSTDGNDTVVGTPTEIGGLKLSILRRTISGFFRRNYKIEVIVQDSIAIDSTTKKLKLQGDSNLPGATKFYGTSNIGAKGWNDLATAVSPTVASLIASTINATRNSTDFNTSFNVLIASNQTVTGAVGTAPTNGTYLIIYEADVAIPAPTGIHSITYRLKSGSTVLNDDRVVLANTLSNPSPFFSQKIMCTAIAALVAAQQVNLNVDSNVATTITGRSITMVKIGV